MTCVRDRTLPVKLSSERCLIHALQLRISNDRLEAYLDTLEASAKRNTGEYVRRVISKLAASKESDDES